MKKLLIGSLAVMGAAAACGGTGGTPASGGPTSTPSSATTISTGSTSIGTVLTDAQGRTLYYLTTEKGGVDKCTNQSGCSAVWPGLVPPSGGSPSAVSGATGQLSVITASDGTKEVTYNGWPLHTFAMDSQSGQANGQGITSFGGTWFAATPGLTTSGGGSAATPSSSSKYTPPAY